MQLNINCSVVNAEVESILRYDEIGVKLRRMRKEAHLTQEQAANLSGWSVKQISYAERGGGVSVKFLLDMVNLYGYDVSILPRDKKRDKKF